MEDKIMYDPTATLFENCMMFVEYALELCIIDCNNNISETMKDPIGYFMNRYDLYVALKKAEEIYYSNIKGFENSPCEPVTLNKFYQFLDDSVKNILNKQNEDINNELQN